MQASQKHNISTNRILNLDFGKPLAEFPCYEFEFYMNLYLANRDHGTLPFEGCLADQPNFIIEVFNIIKSVSFEIQDKERKKQEKQNKRK